MKINISEKRKLNFDVDISGINISNLKGRFIISNNNLEYGFPVQIESNSIKVNIPILNEIITNIHLNNNLDCKLEVFSENFYSSPWSGQLEIVKQPHVDIKEKEVSNSKSNVIRESIDINLQESEKNKFIKFLIKQLVNTKRLLSESITKKTISKFETKKKETNRKQILNKEFKKTIKNEKPKNKKIKNEKDHLNIIKNNLKNKKDDNSMLESTMNIILRNDSNKELTNDKSMKKCIKLMESVGMTSTKTQERILEKAKELGGSDSNAIYSTLEKLLNINKDKNAFEFINEKKILKK